jgi:hypothetical protein
MFVAIMLVGLLALASAHVTTYYARLVGLQSKVPRLPRLFLIQSVAATSKFKWISELSRFGLYINSILRNVI